MFKLVALNANDLLSGIDPKTAEKMGWCSSSLLSFTARDGTLHFRTQCAESRNAWNQIIQIENMELYDDEDFLESNPMWDRFKEHYPDVVYSDIRVGCNCPAFAYFYKYVVDQLGSSTETEPRFPSVRNPELAGTVCKHLASVLSSFFS